MTRGDSAADAFIAVDLSLEVQRTSMKRDGGGRLIHQHMQIWTRTAKIVRYQRNCQVIRNQSLVGPGLIGPGLFSRRKSKYVWMSNTDGLL